jgi:hypothetical protein
MVNKFIGINVWILKTELTTYQFIIFIRIIISLIFHSNLSFIFILIYCTLQNFTVLPTKIFRQCVISSSSVIYLPTSSSTDYVRRLSLLRWFPVPSLYRLEKQKNHLSIVLQTKFVHQKKVSRLKYTDGFLFRRWYHDLLTAIYRR